MPWDEPTGFKQKVQAGVKIHHFAINGDLRPGMLIHFWEGDTTNKSNEFKLPSISLAEIWHGGKFGTDLDEGEIINKQEELLPKCFAVEIFEMTIKKFAKGKQLTLKIGDFFIDTPELLHLVASNEGFNTSEEFTQWFWYHFQDKGTEFVDVKNDCYKATGQIIYWTDQLYDPDSAKALSKIPF